MLRAGPAALWALGREPHTPAPKSERKPGPPHNGHARSNNGSDSATTSTSSGSPRRQ